MLRSSSAPAAPKLPTLPTVPGSPSLGSSEPWTSDIAALDLHSPGLDAPRAPVATILRRRSTESSLLTRLRRGSSSLDVLGGGGGGGGDGGGGGGGGGGSNPPSRRTSRGVSFSDEVGDLPLVRRGSTHSITEYDRAPALPGPGCRPVELDLPPLGTAFLRTPSVLEALTPPLCAACCLARRWRQVFFIFDDHKIRFFAEPAHFLEGRPAVEQLPVGSQHGGDRMYMGQVQHEEGQSAAVFGAGGRVYTITFTLTPEGGARRDLKLGLRGHQVQLATH